MKMIDGKKEMKRRQARVCYVILSRAEMVQDTIFVTKNWERKH